MTPDIATVSQMRLRFGPLAALNLAAVLAVGMLGCGRSAADQEGKPARRVPDDQDVPRERTTTRKNNPELPSLIARLGDADEKRRDAAVEELRTLGKKGISTGDGILLLKASTKTYPPQRFGLGSTSADLIRVVAMHPDVSYVPVVREIFPALKPGTTMMDPRAEALGLLAAIDDEAAALALLDLLEAAVAAGSPPEVQLGGLEEEPRFPHVYFPRILKSARGPTAFGIFSLCLAYASKGAITSEQLAPHAGVVVEAYRLIQTKIASAQTKGGKAWVWDEDYQPVRSAAGLVLDVMGYFPSPDVEAILRQASALKDPRLAYFGAISLMRLGRSVDTKVLEHIAASPEMRSWLFAELHRIDKGELFPAKWATQQMLAEANLVNWLTYPTELGRGPDEIELMKVVSEDFGPPDGVMEWYLFRFRTKPPHWSAKDGWMAGVAGPFKKSEAPTTNAYGDTFSTFTRWDSMSPEQHVADVRKLIERWREHDRGTQAR